MVLFLSGRANIMQSKPFFSWSSVILVLIGLLPSRYAPAIALLYRVFQYVWRHRSWFESVKHLPDSLVGLMPEFFMWSAYRILSSVPRNVISPLYFVFLCGLKLLRMCVASVVVCLVLLGIDYLALQLFFGSPLRPRMPLVV